MTEFDRRPWLVAPTLLVVALAGCERSASDATFADAAATSRLSATPAWQYAAGMPMRAATADLDEDGHLDLVLGREGAPSGTVLVFLGRGTTLFAALPDVQFTVAETSLYEREEQIALGDFDCDGNVDLAVGVWGANSADGQVFVYAGNGDGTFADRTATPSPTYLLESPIYGTAFGAYLAAFDANQDTCADLVVTGRTNTRGFLGSVAGPVLATTWPTASIWTDVVSLGDINGDSRDDLALRDGGGGNGPVTIYLGTSGGFTSSPHRTYWGGSGQLMGGGSDSASGVVGTDIDGDGFTDVAVGLPGDGGSNGRVDIYRGGAGGLQTNPTWSLEGPSDGIAGLYGYALVGGFDHNADGYEDLLVGEPTRDAGTWLHGRWWLVSGTAGGPVTNPSDYLTGARQGLPGAYGVQGWSAGDLDEDGFDDVIVHALGLVTKGTYDTAAQVFVGGTDVDSDGDGSSDLLDCDAKDPNIFPGAAEVVADGIDQNCDGYESCHRDKDGDGRGGASTVDSAVLACDKIGTSIYGDDCNDLNAGVSPQLPEITSNGQDDDCDGNEACAVDADRDGWGSASAVVASVDLACKALGLADNTGDCDDGDKTAFPGAVEVPGDGIDGDCNDVESCYDDKDGDSWGASGSHTSKSFSCAYAGDAIRSGDCNDKSRAIHPGADDPVHDGVDANCDGTDACLFDGDGDGFGGTKQQDNDDADCDDAGEVSAAGDCDDSDAAVHPGAFETGGDGIDSDCTGMDGCYVDGDDDGYGTIETSDACAGPQRAPFGGDCDDAEGGVNPGAVEIAGNAVDDDCSGSGDCFEDGDNDGYGDAIVAVDADSPAPFVECDGGGVSSVSGDCDDASATTNPDADDRVGADADCSGVTTCFADEDGDGFGGASVEVTVDPGSVVPCAADSGDDCDDLDATTNPGATEVIGNATDEDCDGLLPCYLDGDGDGFGTADLVEAPTPACAEPGFAAVQGDCDDADPARAPDVVEVCDGIDNNCDALVDEGYPWVDPADPTGTCDDSRVDFCGCRAATGGAPWGPALLVAVALVRRRFRTV